MISFVNCGYFGRLGNQMFQYAALLGFATYSEQEWGIPKENSVVEKQINLNHIERFVLKDGFNVKYKENPNPQQQFQENGKLVKLPQNTDINGYFQSEKYFVHCIELVKRELSFNADIMKSSINKLQDMNAEDCVSVHIRRGDYVNIPQYHPLCTKEYYKEAMSKFKDRKFLFISDDIEWCKKTFGGEHTYSDGENMFEDMCMMSVCDGHIIANSSFSWWGSWLGNGKTIAPNNWFGEAINNKNDGNIYLKDWIII